MSLNSNVVWKIAAILSRPQCVYEEKMTLSLETMIPGSVLKLHITCLSYVMSIERIFHLY